MQKIKTSKEDELEIIDLLISIKKNKLISRILLVEVVLGLIQVQLMIIIKQLLLYQLLKIDKDLKLHVLKKFHLIINGLKKEIKRSIKFYGKCQYSDYLKKLLS